MHEILSGLYDLGDVLYRVFGDRWVLQYFRGIQVGTALAYRHTMGGLLKIIFLPTLLSMENFDVLKLVLIVFNGIKMLVLLSHNIGSAHLLR